MLLTPAFRNMDASLEEASRVAGASTLGTALRIVVPVMAPAILVGAAARHDDRSLQAFEIEQVLGPPFQFFVFSTKIYDLLVTQRAAAIAAATALARHGPRC